MANADSSHTSIFMLQAAGIFWIAGIRFLQRDAVATESTE
jgi:hypothetical protein